jgi:Zn finger protein HypA/HybF involved in hydrogenase expression
MQNIPRLSSIVDHLLQQLNPANSVYIAVGELTPYTEEQLHAQWSMLVADTILAQAALVIRLVPAEQQCMVCFQKYHPLNKETSCPQCGSVGAKIIAGEEFYLDLK